MANQQDELLWRYELWQRLFELMACKAFYTDWIFLTPGLRIWIDSRKTDDTRTSYICWEIHLALFID